MANKPETQCSRSVGEFIAFPPRELHLGGYSLVVGGGNRRTLNDDDNNNNDGRRHDPEQFVVGVVIVTVARRNCPTKMKRYIFPTAIARRIALESVPMPMFRALSRTWKGAAAADDDDDPL